MRLLKEGETLLLLGRAGAMLQGPAIFCYFHTSVQSLAVARFAAAFTLLPTPCARHGPQRYLNAGSTRFLRGCHS